nr:DUF6723 family protein [Caballeronia sp. GACF4]
MRNGKRPKLVLYPFKPVAPTPGLTENDFAVYASYRGTRASGFHGTLKVVRKTDSKLLYPFDGASPIGPYAGPDEALAAAQQLGQKIVDGDIANPEL